MAKVEIIYLLSTSSFAGTLCLQLKSPKERSIMQYLSSRGGTQKRKRREAK